jgi:hypothetical protein
MLEQRIGREDLAARTGIASRLLGKYRAGTVEPRDAFGDPSDNAHKLADVLGVQVNELLPPWPVPIGGDGPEPARKAA